MDRFILPAHESFIEPYLTKLTSVLRTYFFCWIALEEVSVFYAGSLSMLLSTDFVTALEHEFHYFNFMHILMNWPRMFKKFFLPLMTPIDLIIIFLHYYSSWFIDNEIANFISFYHEQQKMGNFLLRMLIVK